MACDLSSYPVKESVWTTISAENVMYHLPNGFGNLSEWIFNSKYDMLLLARKASNNFDMYNFTQKFLNRKKGMKVTSN